ncbi:MAG TPA: GGDEF domain-containing protein [Candidatus Omnitrophota bacterium]|nr:GGDEF domain-containing protein [Candidatus Omnitrophota bacterium]HPD83839.1 GGDEF domain-containing protein [Candidatus Omnitrophota bacterium]HRZ02696.1 GGDEF domain-containing protein [Candidatus Omnitrophota bacterium]
MANAELLNRKDGLTGFHTKEGLNEYLSSKLTSVYERVSKFSIIILDLDNFKGINDKYGHLAGDDALRYFSGIINKVLKGRFFVARYGGDEFIIAMQDSVDGRESWDIANKVRSLLARERFHTVTGWVKINSSFGIATYPDDEKTPRGLIEMADQALYYAKKHGRNKIVRCQRIRRYSVKDNLIKAFQWFIAAVFAVVILTSFRDTNSLKGVFDYFQNIGNYVDFCLYSRKANRNYGVFKLKDGKLLEGWIIKETPDTFLLSMKKPTLSSNPFAGSRTTLIQPVKVPKAMVYSSIKSLKK